MITLTATVSGYAKPPLPAPEFQVEYVDFATGPVVMSVTSATGQAIDKENFPRFQQWLQRQLNQHLELISCKTAG